MKCAYCNEPGGYDLEDKIVCYDCLQRLKSVPAEQRESFLIRQLELHKGSASRMCDDDLGKKSWLAEIERRLAFLQGREVVTQDVADVAAVATPQKRSGALKVRRF